MTDKRKTMPHLFKKGESGNPGGRPSNSAWKERVEIACGMVFTVDTITEILHVLAKKAKDGDMRAIQLVAERALPAMMSDRHAKIDLSGKTLTEKADAICNAVTAGIITSVQASNYATLIKTYGDTVQNADAERVLSELKEFIEKEKA